MTTDERIQKFWSYVRKTDTCWFWTACKSASGYGMFHFDGTTQRAHRVAFKLTYGHYPNVGRHSCDNKDCVRPDHILDGTKADNSRDAMERGKWNPQTVGKLGGSARNLDHNEAQRVGALGGLAKALAQAQAKT